MISLINISKIVMFLTSTYYIHNKSVASNDDFGLFKMCIRSSVLDVFSQACLRRTDLVVSISYGLCNLYKCITIQPLFRATYPAVRYREDCATSVLVFSK